MKTLNAELTRLRRMVDLLKTDNEKKAKAIRALSKPLDGMVFEIPCLNVPSQIH